MNDYLLITETEQTCWIRINRPNKKNALNRAVVNQLYEHLQSLEHSSFRVLIISGVGDIFCAGADLQEMSQLLGGDESENFEQAYGLACLFDYLDNLPLYTIARVNGDAFGGALGLISCCDMVIAEPSARFCFSELKLGLIPATILPYVLKTIGPAMARRYVLSSEIFNPEQALQMGLVDQICDDLSIDEILRKRTAQILHTQPKAFARAKQYIQEPGQLNQQQIRMTAHQLAQIRTQDEARQAIESFLTRKPD